MCSLMKEKFKSWNNKEEKKNKTQKYCKNVRLICLLWYEVHSMFYSESKRKKKLCNRSSFEKKNEHKQKHKIYNSHRDVFSLKKKWNHIALVCTLKLFNKQQKMEIKEIFINIQHIKIQLHSMKNQKKKKNQKINFYVRSS